MTYYLTYQIKGIGNEQFVMPIQQTDDVRFVCSRIKKEFGIIPNLTARIYGSNLQSSSILSQCVRGQDVVTFDVKETPEGKPKFEMYRKPIIVPRYQSKTTFIVFSTINFKSMTTGDKIKVNLERDTNETLQKTIKDMIGKNYKNNFNAQRLKSMRLLLFLPGGIPFLKGTIGEFVESFPDYMPHIYAIIIFDKNITEKLLDQKFEQVCNIKSKELKTLISPDNDNEQCGLCEIAAILGYIQNNGPNVKRMIYSLAKYCPFAPMICGLYNLALLTQPTGRTIIQITAPLLRLFEEMSNNMPDRSNLFSSTVKFMSFFMNVKICNRVPCTEFVRPFYNIGFEKYFYKHFADENSKLESIVAFDPDFRDQDWIRFQLPSLEEEDFEFAVEHAKTLKVIPPLSLREMHRVSLFQGTNGPWLFLAASISKEEKDKDKIEYINPEVGDVQTGKYEEVAALTTGVNSHDQKDEYIKRSEKLVDPEKVKQIIYICVDKSYSMRSRYDLGLNRFQASLKFFEKFVQACYKFHTTSFYGSIMFNDSPIEKNKLEPLSENFLYNMTHPMDEPNGGTAMFRAMKQAAGLLLQKNKNNKYPNAYLRLVVISDGEDIYSKPPEIASIANYLLQNKIRVDAIIVSSEVAKGLVAISRYTGGVAMFPHGLNEGLDLFNREEFFNVDIRKFGNIHAPNISENDIKSLKKIGTNELDSKIEIKQSEFIDISRFVTSPKYAISEYNKELMAQLQGKVDEGNSSVEVHQDQKRIINELKKIITNPDPDIRVFPLKDRIDVWRVLIKGFEGSLYESKWFYMTVEFPPEYPQHYPLFRFVKPPFHPNITDQGRVCIDTLDQRYRSDKSIRELIGEIRYLLFEPNFDSCVDVNREIICREKSKFEETVNEWNERNGKKDPEDFEKEWKIQPDGKLMLTNMSAATVPEQFLDPISRSIMKEPVKATSGIYYEKRELEKYLKSTPNPACRGKVDEEGKPIPLPLKDNLNLPIDNEMKTKIAKWKKDNDYVEDEDEADENENIAEFRKKKVSITTPDILKNYSGSGIKKAQAPDAKSPFNFELVSTFNNRQISRPRPELK